MALSCPHCDFNFEVLIMNADCHVPPVVHVICQRCSGLSLLEYGSIRSLTVPETAALESNPAWDKLIQPMRKSIAHIRYARNAANN